MPVIPTSCQQIPETLKIEICAKALARLFQIFSIFAVSFSLFDCDWSANLIEYNQIVL